MKARHRTLSTVLSAYVRDTDTDRALLKKTYKSSRFLEELMRRESLAYNFPTADGSSPDTCVPSAAK